MTNQEKFEGFDFSHNPYEQEAREKWGDKAVDEANEKAKKYDCLRSGKIERGFS